MFSSAHKGFTLIELLVVIAIIAILSVVGIAAFKGVTGGARDSARRADIDAIAKAYEINKTSGYIALSDSQFASGKKPQDPNSQKGDYFNWLATDGSGFKVCASLDDNPNNVCNTPAFNCYCKFSSQGSLNPSSPVNQGASTNYTFGLGGSSQQSCDPNGTLYAGLIGYWKMDEASWNGTAGEVKDWAGSNHGTAAGGANTTPGKFGNAGNFNGNYVNIGSGTSLQSLPNVTMSAWVSPTTTPTFGDVVGKYVYANGGMILRISQNGDGKLTPHVYTDTWYTCSGSVIPLNIWTHVAIKYDGTTLKGYVNGAEICTTTPAVGGNLSLNPTGIGIGANIGGGDYFPGLIDDVRIYNRALSSQEISSLWSSGNGCI